MHVQGRRGLTGRLFRTGPTARPRYRASVPSGAVVVSPTRARESLATGSPIHWPTHSGGTNGQRSFAVSRLCARQASQRGLRASILGPQNRLPMTGLCAANATAMKREPRRSKRGPDHRVASKRGIAPRGQRQQDPPRSQESLAFLCPSTARIDRLRQARIRRPPLGIVCFVLVSAFLSSGCPYRVQNPNRRCAEDASGLCVRRADRQEGQGSLTRSAQADVAPRRIERPDETDVVVTAPAHGWANASLA